MSKLRSRPVTFSKLLLDELQPYSGRFTGALRDTLGVVLAVILAETLRVPGISLAVPLLFLMQRERPGLTLQTALQILTGAIAACAATLFWVQMTDGTAEFRFLGLMAGIFISAFCMAGSRLPLFWTIFAFYGFVDIASWDTHRGVNSIVTSALNNLAALALVVVCAAGVEYGFRTSHPTEALNRDMHTRLQALREFYVALADQNAQAVRRKRQILIQLSQAGDMRMNELYDRLRDGHGEMPVGVHFRIGILTRLLEQSIVVGTGAGTLGDSVIAAYRGLSELCGDGTPAVSASASNLIWPTDLSVLRIELEQYWQSTIAPAEPVMSERILAARGAEKFFRPEVFRDPATLFYALKLTLASMVCYVLYNAIAWPGILTCVVTVLFTGLSSTGAMKQKQLYRFAGAACGGALGVGTLSLLFPMMDSITSLVLVVGFIALLSGWILRGPHMGYVGVQIAFAFSLTALPGFSAATALAPARDRLIGIGLGIVVMWFIFDQLWPVSAQDELRRILAVIQSATQLLVITRGDFNAEEISRLRAQVSSELLLQQQLESSIHFDVGASHARQIVQSGRLVRQIDEAAVAFYSCLSSHHQEHDSYQRL